MANLYEELKERNQQEFNAFPVHFAFGNEQIQQKVQELGFSCLEELKDNCVGIGAGGFILKADVPAFKEMCDRHNNSVKEAMNDEKTGEQFIVDMFESELNNHEYGYTRDVSDALRALGFSANEVVDNPRLNAGLCAAVERIEAFEKAQEAAEPDITDNY